MPKYFVQQLSPDQWGALSEKMHLVVFDKLRPKELERISFALIAECNEQLGGYITCKEMDSETLYIQYGGAFPNFSKSHYVLGGYLEMIKWCTQNYARVWTRIENKNVPMIKLALQAGFIVTGTSLMKNNLYVEFSKGDI